MEILIALGHAGYREVDLQMAGEVGISKLIQTEREISGLGTSSGERESIISILMPDIERLTCRLPGR